MAVVLFRVAAVGVVVFLRYFEGRVDGLCGTTELRQGYGERFWLEQLVGWSHSLLR